MNQIQAISQRLEQYVADLNRTIENWQQWLVGLEEGTAGKLQQNAGNALASEALFQSLNKLMEQRQQVLAEAKQMGKNAANVYSLARTLPIWANSRFRNSLESARIRLAHLRRNHVATWVLLQESTSFCQDSLMLMMSGKTHRDFTIDQSPPEAGGHLLDASL